MAKADAIASREAIQISGDNASGGNASTQEPGGMFEPLEEEQLASSTEGEMAKELAKIAKLIRDMLAKLQETATVVYWNRNGNQPMIRGYEFK